MTAGAPATLLQGFASRAGSAAPIQLAAQVVVIGIGASVAAGLVALGYRWYVRERVPTGLAVLFGLSVVAVSLVPTGALGPVIRGDDAVLGSEYVLRNLAAFALGAAGSSVGIRVGDAVGTDLFAATGGREVDRDIGEIVQTVGRVTSVRLPEEIADIVGYDPMPDGTKETLAGRRFLFPRRLTKTELRERLVSRLKTDYGVGHVDLELRDDGTVDYLAVGSRAAGIGPTLPPATNAVAIRADPAHAASAGDLVQVWETDPLSRVLTGELRGVAGDVVTVAIDTGDTPKLDPTAEYKLVTLPVQDRPDREFASLLRAAEETMGTVTVPADSELVGTAIGDLGVTVAAVTREDAAPEPIPSRGRVLESGDVVYAIAKPEALRRVEAAAGRKRASEPPSDSSGPSGGDATGDTSDAGPTAESSGAVTDDTDGTEQADGAAADAETTGDVETADTGDEGTDAPPGDTDGTSPDGETTTPEADDPATEEPADESTDDSEDGAADRSDDESVTVWDPEERLEDETAGESGERDEATDDSTERDGDGET